MTENEIKHYGTPRKSGRYPWGSGDEPYQSGASFQAQVAEMRSRGMSDTAISRAFGMTTTQFRAKVAIASAEERAARVAQAKKLRDTGMGPTAIGREMGVNESTVRSLLDESRAARTDVLMNTANMLESEMGNKKYLDIGLGSEVGLGISKEKLATSVAILEEKGYVVHNIQVPQVGNPNQYTEVKVLAPPGTTFKDVLTNQHEIRPIQFYTENNGVDFRVIQDPIKVDPKRLAVVYGSEGGDKKDGLIELRPNVDDISLGGSSYAQVRIAIGDDKYIKGMAVYNKDLPPGVDIRFNTNKEFTGNKLDALKGIKDDPDSPFGSTIRQKTYIGPDGKEHLSALNIVGSPLKPGSGEEGSWNEWSRTLSSQMLSKQSPQLAKQQLDLAFRDRKADFDEIMALTNPAVKKKLLESFAEDVDASTVKMPGKALPGQSNKVLIPINSLKPNEVYAPGYNNGTEAYLVRHPHGGIFEIPLVKVNNRNREGKEILGNAIDAIGINHKVAAQLSGADFDGDHVLFIPKPKMGAQVKIKKPLEGLKEFNPSAEYPGYPGMKRLAGDAKQREMGIVSNLITDMTIRGASERDIVTAVKHSMVVIDAEKHALNWKQSEKDNEIAYLKKKYQIKDDGKTGGASTLISRSSSPVRVPKARLRPYRDGGPIDPKTGEKVWVPTGDSYTKTTKRGTQTTVYKTMEMYGIHTVRDANKLSSGKGGTDIERVYATHANRLKALANQARLESLKTPPIRTRPEAKRAYAHEVATLKAKLNTSLKNKPLERTAQILANYEIKSKTQADPALDKDQLSKLKTQSLMRSRARVGATGSKISITPREWEAIQAGAIANSTLVQILSKADSTQVKQYATPKTQPTLTPAKKSHIKAMAARGYTQAEIAQQLGVSTSLITQAISE